MHWYGKSIFVASVDRVTVLNPSKMVVQEMCVSKLTSALRLGSGLRIFCKFLQHHLLVIVDQVCDSSFAAPIQEGCQVVIHFDTVITDA
jgi:hypothetical protein